MKQTMVATTSGGNKTPQIYHYDEKTRSQNEDGRADKNHDFATIKEELPKGYYRSPYFIGTCTATTLSQTSGVGTYIMVASLLGQIDADIGPSDNLLWVPTAYTLCTAVGLLLFGRLTDLFGRRWFFIGASLLGLIGSAIGATAQNINTVVGAEVLIGLGATAGLSYTTVLGELVPMKYRFFAVGILFIGNIPVGGFGAAIAYAFQLHTAQHWRWVFWLTVITNGAAAICWFLFYTPPTFQQKHVNQTRMHLIKNFDYIGTFLFIAGFVLFLVGLVWGGVVYPWKSAPVISTIVIGVICLVALGFWETFASLKEPLIPVHLFKNRGWVAANLLLAVGASVYYAGALLWPQMVSVVYSNGNMMWTGWVSSLVGISIAMGELTGGVVAEKLGRVKYQCMFMVTAGSICLACMATVSVSNQSTVIGLVVTSLFTIGWNECIAFSLTTILIKNQQEIGAAAGIAGSTRSIISTIASTIYQVVLRARLLKTVPAEVIPAILRAGLPKSSVASYLVAMTTGSAEAFQDVEGVTPNILAAGSYAYRVANAHAFKDVFITSIAFACIAIGLSTCIPNVEHLMTHDVATMLHQLTNEDVVAGCQEDAESR